MNKQLLSAIGALVLAEVLAQAAYFFGTEHHIDLAKPIFVGIIVYWIVSMHVAKFVAPAALALLAAIAEVVYQVVAPVLQSQK